MYIVQFQFMSHRCSYEASNFSDGRTQISSNSDVVYFDQLMHACACVRMVENGQKHQTFFFVFLCKPLMCLSCTWWKRYFFDHFPMFFIVFNHANACASMHLLVEIHNIQIKSNFWIRLSQVIFIFLMIRLKLGSNIKHFKNTIFFH